MERESADAGRSEGRECQAVAAGAQGEDFTSVPCQPDHRVPRSRQRLALVRGCALDAELPQAAIPASHGGDRADEAPDSHRCNRKPEHDQCNEPNTFQGSVEENKEN